MACRRLTYCTSLGNLVIRHYYGDMADPTGSRRPDPRLKRIVMLGPPNAMPA